jgi:hypothetical protein
MNYSYKQQLEEVEKELNYLLFRRQKLEQYKPWEAYFSKVSQSAKGRSKRINSMLTDMRKLAFKKLFKEGLHRPDICAIININHSSLCHYLSDNLKSSPFLEEVEQNYEKWIKDGVYPRTSFTSYKDPETNRKSPKMEFEIVPIKFIK